MKITEYINDLAWLPPPISCDKIISDKIKEPLPNTAACIAFCGAAGSGKTSAAIGWLTNTDMYHRQFHNVFLVMPKNSRLSLAGDPFKNHSPDKLYDDLTLQVLEFVQEYCQVEAPENHYSLLLIDDCAAALKDANIQNLFKKLIFNRRHLKLTIWFLVQSYNSIPLQIRKNLSHLVVFKPRNKLEMELIGSEIICLNKNDQLQLSNHVFDTPYNFMLINTANNKIYKNFNELVIES